MATLLLSSWLYDFWIYYFLFSWNDLLAINVIFCNYLSFIFVIISIILILKLFIFECYAWIIYNLFILFTVSLSIYQYLALISGFHLVIWYLLIQILLLYYYYLLTLSFIFFPEFYSINYCDSISISLYFSGHIIIH